MAKSSYSADVLIAGGGLAGLSAALELLDSASEKLRILIVDKDSREKLGGLARESFGGVHLIGTPHQRKMGISDSAELGFRDWERTARFESEDEWPRRWAALYCERSEELIFRFLNERGVKFLPLVNWAERGLHHPGNSVPRWHIAWGTGLGIVEKLVRALDRHPRRTQIEFLFRHEVSALEASRGRITGVRGRSLPDGAPFEAKADRVVIATGGICGGDLSRVRANWFRAWGKAPAVLLNGSHPYADGLLHDEAARHGARLTHLDRQWHYAAGVHHPAPRKPDDGLSLVPPRSALWMNARGERIGPVPLVSYTDTRFLVESILKEPGQYSWQILNWKIAIRELAVSGSDYMTAFREKRKLTLALELVFGNRALVRRLIRECPEDFVTASSLPELADRMNERSLEGQKVDLAAMERAIREYDDQIGRGEPFFNDDQLRRIANFRQYRPDRLRTCRFQKILDQKALPLIAIREFILSRKSLGGIQTDLHCRVLNEKGAPIEGLYAIGEAAGFGGGGIHGIGSLEGTFLGSCILTGRIAARAVARGG